MLSTQHNSPATVARLVSRTYWRAVLGISLLLAGVALAVGYGVESRMRAERLAQAAQQLQTALAETQREAQRYAAKLPEEPTLQNGLRLLARYRDAAADRSFFQPVAQEMSTALLAVAQLLPTGAMLHWETPLFELHLTASQVWWRHRPSKTVWMASVGRVLHPEANWPTAETDPRSPGWHWDAAARQLLLISEHRDTAQEGRLWVQMPFAAQQLEAILVRNGWRLASVRLTAPSVPEEEEAPFWVSTAESSALLLRQKHGATIELALDDLLWSEALFWGVAAGGAVLVGLVALVLGAILRRGLRNAVTRPLRSLGEAVTNLDERGESLAQLDTTGWPREVVAIRNALLQQWRLARQHDAENRWLALALTHVADGVVLTDLNERIRYLNAAAERLFGFPLAEAKGKKPGELWGSDQTPPKVYQLLHETLARGEPFAVTFHNRTRTGSAIDVDETIAPVKDEQGQVIGYVATFHEVTDEQRMIEALKAAQFTDPLTQLPNRLGLIGQLRGWFGTQQRVTLMHIDIDHFAAVNAQWGLQAGDALLCRVAERLKQLQQQWREARLQRFSPILRATHSWSPGWPIPTSCATQSKACAQPWPSCASTRATPTRSRSPYRSALR